LYVSAFGPGCRAGDEGAAEPSESTPTHAAAESDRTPPDRGSRPLVIDLHLDNLSPLYKGFFSHKPFIEQLAMDLAPHIRSQSVTIKVVWDDEHSSGSIQMLVPDGEQALDQAGQHLDDERRMDTAPLDPYLRALDGYRKAVGDRYDMRVLSFGLHLELWDPRSESRCLWPVLGGDAAALALGPTVECWQPLGERFTLERRGDAWPAEMSGTKKQRRILAGALGQ
jgi:hypothetical protein